MAPDTAASEPGNAREAMLDTLTGALRRVEIRHVTGIAEADTRAAADELLTAIWPLVVLPVEHLIDAATAATLHLDTCDRALADALYEAIDGVRGTQPDKETPCSTT